MTKNIIRIIISSYYLFLIYSWVFNPSESVNCTSNTSCKILDEIPDSMFLLGTISVIGSMIFLIVSLFGLMRFKKWSRPIFIIYFLLYLVSTVGFEPYTTSSLTNSGSIFYYLVTIGLVILIYSPYVTKYFNENNELNIIKNKTSIMINVLAWFLLAIATFMLITYSIQYFAIHMFTKPEYLQRSFESKDLLREFPLIFKFVFINIKTLTLFCIIIYIVLFVSSIGVLERKQWARKTYILLMASGTIWSVGSIIVQLFFISFIWGHIDILIDTSNLNYKLASFNYLLFYLIIPSIIVTILFSYITKMLLSNKIRQEFLT